MPDMQPVSEAIAPREWTQDDSQALRAFLLANPHFLQHLRKRMPRTNSKKATTTEQAACAGQQMEGWLSSIEEIMVMAFPTEAKKSPTSANIAV